MANQIKNKGENLIRRVKSFFVLSIMLVGIFGTSSKTNPNAPQISIFNGVNIAHADTPSCGSCDGGSCSSCDGGSCGGCGGGVCANCVGGCSYSDGTCGGQTDNSGTGVCGASANCEGGCGGSSSCASSGTGCGLY